VGGGGGGGGGLVLMIVFVGVGLDMWGYEGDLGGVGLCGGSGDAPDFCRLCGKTRARYGSTSKPIPSLLTPAAPVPTTARSS